MRVAVAVEVRDHEGPPLRRRIWVRGVAQGRIAPLVQLLAEVAGGAGGAATAATLRTGEEVGQPPDGILGPAGRGPPKDGEARVDLGPLLLAQAVGHVGRRAGGEIMMRKGAEGARGSIVDLLL